MNDWNEWSKYVLKAIEKLEEDKQTLESQYDQLSRKVDKLSFKLTIIAAVGPVLVTAVFLLIKVIFDILQKR